MADTLDIDKLAKYKEKYDEAHKGCDVCPCCGESRLYENTKGLCGIQKQDRVYKYVWKICPPVIFETRAQDRYKCFSCGARWESDWFVDVIGMRQHFNLW